MIGTMEPRFHFISAKVSVPNYLERASSRRLSSLDKLSGSGVCLAAKF